MSIMSTTFKYLDTVMRTLDFICKNVSFYFCLSIATFDGIFHSITLFLRILQPEDESMLHANFLEMGLEEWIAGDLWIEGVRGQAIFKTFEQTFQALIKGSSNEGITLIHNWYTDWSWISTKNSDELFFEAMDLTLNDDCIREIIKYFDVLQCVYFGTINQRFRDLTVCEMSRNLYIFPSTVGSIGLMNWRFLLELLGNSVINISLSLTSFYYFGFCFSHTKISIVNIIYACTGPQLKKIHLIDFHLDESEEIRLAPTIQLLTNRGVEVNWS